MQQVFHCLMLQYPHSYPYQEGILLPLSPPRRGARRAGWVNSSRAKLALCQVQPTPAPPKRESYCHLPLLGGVPGGRGG
jgi:hypothetical protein